MITLKPITEADLPAIVRWRNDPQVNRWISDRIKTIPDAEKWFDRIKANPDNRLDGIYEGDTLIGYSIVEGVDMINRRCEIGIIIGDPKSWGRGIGAAVLKEQLRYAFEERRLHRVYGYVARGNERSERLLRSAGFVHEGTQRESLIIHGELSDLLLYSMLEQEYRGA